MAAGRAKVIETEVKCGAEAGPGFEGKAKHQGGLLGAGTGKEGGRDGCRTQRAAVGVLGASRQQPRAATDVGTFLKAAQWPGRLKEALDCIRKGQKTQVVSRSGARSVSSQQGDWESHE